MKLFSVEEMWGEGDSYLSTKLIGAFLTQEKAKKFAETRWETRKFQGIISDEILPDIKETPFLCIHSNEFESIEDHYLQYNYFGGYLIKEWEVEND